MLKDLLVSARIVAASMALLCAGYTGLVLGAATLIAPGGRLGSLAEVDGRVVGSWLIAQAFTRPEYIWPRPSAASYAANAASGSNLSPANPATAERAKRLLQRLGATRANPAPAELALASGSGLDPHVTLAAALYQAPRVAAARRVEPARVEGVIRSAAERQPGGGALVNVLRVNLLLDREAPMASAGDNR